jgi:amidase
MELYEYSAIQLAAAIRDGEVTAVEVTEQAVAQAERLGPEVGAFTVVAGDLAREQAHRIDVELAAGTAPSVAEAPLLGVPCPIKDLDAVGGVLFQSGSLTQRGNVADEDSDIARRFAGMGTVMLGKTNTPEFGLPCYTEPEVAPPARTPWDSTRSAGGSSGGAAAAVAAGIVPIAHGSDGGGSIRIPASACGLVGLKPSRGRVSPGPNMPGPGLTTNGVLTRDVRDTAVALDFLSRPQVGDVYYAPQSDTTFLQACERPVTGLRVGVLTRPVIADATVHPEALAAVARAAADLEGLGHHIEDASLPFAPERWQAFAALWSIGALAIPVPAEQEPNLRPLTRWLRDQGRASSGLQLAQAWYAAQQLAHDTALAWSEYDLILTPTLAQPPAKIGSIRDDADPAADFQAQTEFTPWTSVYNVSGLPAISLPLHRARIDGATLPIGVMLGAAFGQEALLLSVAAQLEAADPWPHTPVETTP